MKVHVVEADLTGNIMTIVEKRDDLGRAIAQLAKQMNEPVHFHDFVDPVAGAPIVMIECSDAFIAQVERLNGVSRVHDVWPDLATARSANIQAYFERPKFQTPAANDGVPPSMRKPRAPGM